MTEILAIEPEFGHPAAGVGGSSSVSSQPPVNQMPPSYLDKDATVYK